MRQIIGLLRDTGTNWSEDNASHWAATLAFYTMISAGPLLVLAVALAGFVWGEGPATQALLAQVHDLMGQEAANVLGSLMAQAAKPHDGIMATVVGLGTLVFGATNLFAGLQDAMDAIWHVKPRSDNGIKIWLKQRFLSASMVLGIGFLLLVSLVFNALFASLWDSMGPAATILAQTGEFVSEMLLGTALLAAIFRVLPDARLPWRTALLGAAITALLLNIGKVAIGHYLGMSGVTDPFGAAGSLALVLLWVYYAAQVLLFGAALTRALAERMGHGIEPAADAMATKVVEDPTNPPGGHDAPEPTQGETMLETLAFKAAKTAAPPLLRAAKNHVAPAVINRVKRASPTPWLMLSIGFGIAYLVMRNGNSDNNG